jgi:hypothetical protein
VGRGLDGVFIIATVVSFLGGAARDNGLDRGGEPLFARFEMMTLIE